MQETIDYMHKKLSKTGCEDGKSRESGIRRSHSLACLYRNQHFQVQILMLYTIPNRIVSVSQPFGRPIVREKADKAGGVRCKAGYQRCGRVDTVGALFL